MIASGVRISDNDGHPIDPGARERHEPITPDETAPVVIGENVWIGARAIILKGVTIGDNAIVGAASVVTKPVPANSVVAGNPAKFVKSLDPPKAG